MKILLLLMLVGYASATLLEALERESRGILSDFRAGMQASTPLHQFLGIGNNDAVQRLEKEIKEILGKYVKDVLEIAVEKINDAMHACKHFNEKAIEKMNELRKKMEKPGVNEKDLETELADFRDMADSQLNTILEKMEIVDKISNEPGLVESDTEYLSLRTLFTKLKQMIVEKIDTGVVKSSLEKIVGQGTQRFFEWISNKGQEKVLHFFHRVLDSNYETKKCAYEEDQELKDSFENLEKDIENKVSNFRKWIHHLISSGLAEANGRIQILREIGKEVITHSKDLTKKETSEVLNYLQNSERESSSFSEDLRRKIEKVLNKTD